MKDSFSRAACNYVEKNCNLRRYNELLSKSMLVALCGNKGEKTIETSVSIWREAYLFLLKSVMCSFWRMAFASTYIQSCDEEAIQVQQHNFALELPPNFLRFKSTTFSLVCENPLRVEYWHILNEFEDITGGTKSPISLATIRVAILLQYVPEGLESYVSGRSKRRLTRKLGQADRRGQRKRKAKKFLCSPPE